MAACRTGETVWTLGEMSFPVHGFGLHINAITKETTLSAQYNAAEAVWSRHVLLFIKARTLSNSIDVMGRMGSPRPQSDRTTADSPRKSSKISLPSFC
jgi:hypothetical protein